MACIRVFAIFSNHIVPLLTREFGMAAVPISFRQKTGISLYVEYAQVISIHVLQHRGS